MWAFTLAAHVPDSWEAVIVDSIFESTAGIGPSDVFAFSGINQDVDCIRRVHDELKDRYPEATFIVGGPITWSLEQERKLDILEYFDFIFVLDGEETLPRFLIDLDSGNIDPLLKIIRTDRFSLTKARKIRFDLYRPKADHYYGALVEVSRGCPFLCEFCDIRVLPGNNQSHTKNIDLIIEEMDEYYKLGITQFQFACDNFIGDIVWARKCVDAIIEWKQRTGAKIAIFTWLTINLYKMPDLMQKMGDAGFSILFIGIESVNQNSLLETAKVQNNLALDQAVRTIQSYGFIIAPGFIFGFDSDTEHVFDETLDFLKNSGLIGGDPSFLMALPGTPLFARMKKAGRLIDEDTATVRNKITTNIRYLLDADAMVDGFIYFMETYTSPEFQLARYKNHVSMLMESDTLISQEGSGYGSPLEYIQLQFKDMSRLKDLFRRIFFITKKPLVLWAVLQAWWLTKKCTRQYPGLGLHFNYWVYVWTNMAVKYRGLNIKDFAISSVGADFDISTIIESMGKEGASSDAPHVKGDVKVSHQRRYTEKALRKLANDRLNT